MLSPSPIDWEVSVLDKDGRTRTFTVTALARPQALAEFKRRSRWTTKQLNARLVRCAPKEEPDVSDKPHD